VEAFEELTARHGMEKIKTVGDALMATANLLVPHEDPVMAAVRLGFDLIEAARDNPARWDLRVAIHVGAVVAGIVGRSKFSFDVWGDTVNTAARLAGVGGAAIHLSDAAWAKVADRCRARCLGPVPIKGKGMVEVYCCEEIQAGRSAIS
jgi:class 3 adenylate cyclase